MSKQTSRRSPACWLLPLLFALPLIAAGAYAVMRYGPEIASLCGIAVKMVVIPW